MSRTARIIIPGLPHHVTQRGNRGQDTFFCPDDYQQYLLWLEQYAVRYGLRVWAYCLMSNHIHLVAVPTTAEAVGQVLRSLQMRHSQHVNAAQGTTGHLWHGRYYSCVLDEPHLLAAVRYVERNPVRAGLVERAEEYMWSSARPHCGLRKDPVLTKDIPLAEMVGNWTQWLMAPEDDAVASHLRRRTLDGDPCGSEAFRADIAGRIGRDLTRRPVGRPVKN